MKLLKRTDIKDLIYIDIETVRGYRTLEEAPTIVQEAWEYKLRYSPEKLEGMEPKEAYIDKAALYPEFGKIACVTIGFDTGDSKLLLKSCYEGQELKNGEVINSEKELLTTINKVIHYHAKSTRFLCGHAIKGFDIPYVMRRAMVHDIHDIHDLFDTSMLKPWELNAIDTNELWKGTGFYGASILAIAAVLNLPSPKIDIVGSETSDIYYSDDPNRFVRIKDYCERDVVTVANIVRKLRNEPLYE